MSGAIPLNRYFEAFNELRALKSSSWIVVSFKGPSTKKLFVILTIQKAYLYKK